MPCWNRRHRRLRVIATDKSCHFLSITKCARVACKHINVLLDIDLIKRYNILYSFNNIQNTYSSRRLYLIAKHLVLDLDLDLHKKLFIRVIHTIVTSMKTYKVQDIRYKKLYLTSVVNSEYEH